MRAVTVAVPNAFAAEVNVSVPAGEIAGCTLNNVELLLLTTNETVCDPSPGPALIAVAHALLYAPESSAAVTSAPALKLGASLTAVTLIVNVAGAVLAPPSSVAVYVTIALPFAFAAGVNVSVPLPEIAGCTENNALL